MPVNPANLPPKQITDPNNLAVIESLGKMDTQDSGISFDIKVKKSSKIQNVHVAIPAWVFVVAGIIGGASAIVLINEVVKELTGEGFLPEMPEKTGLTDTTAGKIIDPFGLFR